MPANRAPSRLARWWVSFALLGLMSSLAVVIGHSAGGWGWALLLATPLGVATALVLMHWVWR